MKKHIILAVLLGLSLTFVAASGLRAQDAESYESLMRSGETKFAAKDYISAKTYFELALKKKAKDAAAQQKLSETLKKIQEDGARQEIFYSHLDQGDALYAGQKYDEALAEYNKALSFYPDDKYVNTQANAVKAILEQRQANLNSFNEAIAQGNTLLESDNYDAAIMQFETAAKIFPTDNLPKERITEARRLKQIFDDKTSRFDKLVEDANALALRKNYDGAIGKLNQALELFPNDDSVKKQIQSLLASKGLNDQYSAIIADADQLYENKSYQDAKTKYQAALSIMPDDSYATDMIQRINNVFESPEYIAQANYNNAIAKGVELESQSQYALALNSFQEALSYKPKDEFATSKINSINETLRIQKEQADLEQHFNELMANGDAAEKNGTLESALSLYTEASQLKPDNETAKSKIAAIRSRLQSLADAEKNYNDFIAKADGMFNAKQYAQSIEAYQNALTIKPGEAYPQQQIEAAQKGMTEQAALAAQQALDERYASAVAQADGMFNAKQYAQSIEAYQNALTIKPGETYPQQRIEAAQKGMAEQAALAEQQALDERYASAVAQADEMFNAKQYAQSIEAYQNALTLKPDEAYPQRQIEAAQKGLADIAAQKAIDDRYAAAIALADSLFNVQQYENAITSYRDALTIKQNENYPQQQITASQNRISELASEAEKQQQIQTLLSEGDAFYASLDYQSARKKYADVIALESTNAVATAKIKEIDDYFAKIAAENQQKYDAAITAGDGYLAQEDYAKAIGQYQIALASKPGDEYATKQLDGAQKLDSERIASLRTQYTTYVREGDAFYKSNTLDKAVESYTKAEELNLGETYPTEMISRISRIIEENKLYELSTETFTLAANTKQRYTFKPVDVAARRNNYIIFKIRNLNPGKNFPMIVSFGSEAGKNGGFVLPISASELEKTYIFRVGSQYKWFSEDNTWLEIISENDDVEVSMVEISRSN